MESLRQCSILTWDRLSVVRSMALSWCGTSNQWWDLSDLSAIKVQSMMSVWLQMDIISFHVQQIKPCVSGTTQLKDTLKSSRVTQLQSNQSPSPLMDLSYSRAQTIRTSSVSSCTIVNSCLPLEPIQTGSNLPSSPPTPGWLPQDQRTLLSNSGMWPPNPLSTNSKIIAAESTL